MAALTDEERRALDFNLQHGRRAMACSVRRFLLKGSEAAKEGLTRRMQAVTRGEIYEPNKVRYDENLDPYREGGGCAGDAINGDRAESERAGDLRPGAEAGVPRH